MKNTMQFLDTNLEYKVSTRDATATWQKESTYNFYLI